MNYWNEERKGRNIEILVNVLCQESNGKKQVTTLKLPQLYEPFEAIATFRAICSKFLAKHRHP